MSKTRFYGTSQQWARERESYCRWKTSATIFCDCPFWGICTISGVTGGGGAECLPRLLTGIFLLTYREKRGKKKKGKGWKLRRKEGKLLKGRWKIENGRYWKVNGRWKSYKKLLNEERTFLFCIVLFGLVFVLFVCFVLFCFFFCFSLFKTTKICFGSTKWKFSTGKNISRPEKKGKMPSQNSCYAPYC